MKNFIKQSLTIIFIMTFFSFSALANEWKVDHNHSSIRFGVKHILSKTWGHFSDFDGKIQFDPNDLTNSLFNFTIKVDSIDTANGKRDTHLRSDDFFASNKFPTMHFESSQITHKGGSDYSVTGTMTLKESSRTMEIPFTYHGTADSPFQKNETVTGFETEFTIDRLDFGVGNGKFFKMGVVDKTVKVIISLEATRKK